VKKLFLPLALVISLHPYEAAAVMPLEIKSEDVYQAGWLCCTNRLRDSCCESSVVADPHEQTDITDLQDHELDCLQ
jgi:hypothetical protein